jgi:hypothetical protein
MKECYSVPKRINLCTHPQAVKGLIALVGTIHAAFTVFMVATPLLGDIQMLFMHAFLVPFVVLHWAWQTDACAVSMTECYLFGLQKEHSFVHRIVHPIFMAGNALDDNRPTYGIALLLWLATLCRIWRAGLLTTMLTEFASPFMFCFR